MNEPTRHWLYIGVVVVIVALIVFDVIARDGDVAGWVGYLAAVAGIGGATMAAKNTTANPKVDLNERLTAAMMAEPDPTDLHRDDDDPTGWDLDERDRVAAAGLLDDGSWPDPTEVLVEEDQ